jgi:tRNA (cytidine/uridine-2'-O-)-methyltransferase
MVRPKMKVVLVEPEIPFNTGSIGRTCVALDLELILIGQLGFSLDSSSIGNPLLAIC